MVDQIGQLKGSIMFFKNSLILIFTFALSACTTSYWYHPSKNQAQANRDSFACERIANQMYPVRLVERKISSGYRGSDYTECRPVGSTVQCFTYPGVYQPPKYVTEDVNRFARPNAYDNCMKGRGYTLKYKDIPLF